MLYRLFKFIIGHRGGMDDRLNILAQFLSQQLLQLVKKTEL